ncbi:acyl-CoA dehydrogenase [Algoriphagus sanaruensis]|uniref:Acyl-CoA dehydrogenase n=1 Tax=Algoriphagus sanaruensis TaxID=1727163 RepID=A0A142ENP6_9BACT|nr:acyl-CoA dehydrogenase [Algoriphagus sanaruensis]
MSRFYSKKDLIFQLFENQNVLNLTALPNFSDHSEDTFKLILDAAEQIATNSLYPIFREMDRQEPQLIDGLIRIHPGMKSIIQKFGQDGWVNAIFPYDEGGQQLPWTIHMAAGFIFQAANYSASVFPFLTTGAANLIRTFGSEQLKENYLPKMYSGNWQGTMALTEPDAGSSLSDLSTTAFPTDQPGVFKIRGQKIYISAGDHDACENIIHLMLARISGAPSGTKGISLFVVPKIRLDGKPNDVLTQGIYHKMGYKGAPIAHLMMGSQDDCEGYLVGEENLGLKYMFQMMNEARLGVGMNAVAIATAAFHASLTYAKERPQGRKANEKDLQKPQIPIIEHADVKRMLLVQKCITEGSLALLIYCGILSDKIAQESDKELKLKQETLLDFLTPIAKSYPSEMGVISTSHAVQVLGGAGYTTDFPVEQYFRESRIHPIHEGTTGIHGLDLLGRKVWMEDGLGWKLWLNEIQEGIGEAKRWSELIDLSTSFEKQLTTFIEASGQMFEKRKLGAEILLADASLFLEACGIVSIAWMWVKQAITAQEKLQNGTQETHFYLGKIEAFRYFISYELPKLTGIIQRFYASDFPTLTMEKEWF